MSLLHALISRRATRFHAFHHHRHHGHDHHRFDGTHAAGDTDGLDGRAEQAARMLNLNTEQIQKLSELIAQLDTFRATKLKGEALQDLRAVLATGKLERQAIQAFVDRRIAQVQQSMPPVVASLGDFIEALNADQQQTVQVLLRLLAGHGARAPSSPAAEPEQAP